LLSVDRLSPVKTNRINMQNTKGLLLLLIFLVSVESDLFSQKRERIRIDNLMKQIPDSSTNSTNGIASYIAANIHNQKNRAYAIFSWITENINYDVENMFNINFYQESDAVVSSALSDRKGICLHFSYLFQKIATRLGIRSYVVLGYTKQNGLMDQIPHSWCAGLIDTTWYLFDPAWGSGYLEKGTFLKERNQKYFLVPPSKLIKSHMPFDPMWQFLDHPITNQDYYNKRIIIDPGNPYFNFIDSINKYDHQSDLEKLQYSIPRIRQNGITNVLIARELEYLFEQILSLKYNEVVILYNEGISKLNQSIMIWNEFNPDKNTNTISGLLDLADFNMTLCRQKLSHIENQTGIVRTSINQMYSLIDIAENNIKNIRSSVERYINSRK
jgi:transglutaminase/protease-like cytokinesis protein 3